MVSQRVRGHLLLCYLLFSPLHISNTRARRTHGPASIYVSRPFFARGRNLDGSGTERVRTRRGGNALECPKKENEKGRKKERDSEKEREGYSRRTRGRRRENGSVLSQACNARGHRSRNISCQADSNGSNGGGDGVDTGVEDCRDNWTLTIPEVRVMTLGGVSRAHAKTSRPIPSAARLGSPPFCPFPVPFSTTVYRHLFPTFMAKDT